MLLMPGGVVGDGRRFELDVHDDTPVGEMNTTQPEHPASGRRQRTVVARHFMTPSRSTIYCHDGAQVKTSRRYSSLSE
jgi:hypothetical protein